MYEEALQKLKRAISIYEKLPNCEDKLSLVHLAVSDLFYEQGMAHETVEFAEKAYNCNPTEDISDILSDRNEYLRNIQELKHQARDFNSKNIDIEDLKLFVKNCFNFYQWGLFQKYSSMLIEKLQKSLDVSSVDIFLNHIDFLIDRKKLERALFLSEFALKNAGSFCEKAACLYRISQILFRQKNGYEVVNSQLQKSIEYLLPSLDVSSFELFSLVCTEGIKCCRYYHQNEEIKKWITIFNEKHHLIFSNNTEPELEGDDNSFSDERFDEIEFENISEEGAMDICDDSNVVHKRQRDVEIDENLSNKQAKVSALTPAMKNEFDSPIKVSIENIILAIPLRAFERDGTIAALKSEVSEKYFLQNVFYLIPYFF
jgi:tetratricopeptide (TPR) repeat protein